MSSDLDTDSFFEKMKLENERKFLAREQRIRTDKRRLLKKKKKKKSSKKKKKDGRSKKAKPEKVDNKEDEKKKKRLTPTIRTQSQLRKQIPKISYTSPLDLLNKLQYDINCLLSPEKMKKFASLRKIQTNLIDLPAAEKEYIFPHIYRELTSLLEDSSEFCRENGIHLLSRFLLDCDASVTSKYTECVSACFGVILERFQPPTTPKNVSNSKFHEESEEVRKLLIVFLHDLVRKIDALCSTFLDEIVEILKFAYKDYFRVQIEAHLVTNTLCSILSKDTETKKKNLLPGIAPVLLKHMKMNLVNNRAQVRISAIETFLHLVMNDGAQRDFHEYESQLVNLTLDHSPKVRSGLLTCVRELALHWLDKYSFIKQLLTVLMLLVNDEDEEIAQGGFSTLEKVGENYIKVKKSEMKDELSYKVSENVDFDKISQTLPFPYTQKRVNYGTRVLVDDNKTKMVEFAIERSADWDFRKRVSSAQFLATLVVYCEDSLISKMQVILVNMFKAIDDEEKDVVAAIGNTLDMLGRYIEPRHYLLVVRNHIKSMYSDSPRYLTNVLGVCEKLLGGVCDEYIRREAQKDVLELLADMQEEHMIHPELLMNTLKICDVVVEKFSANLQVFRIVIKCLARQQQGGDVQKFGLEILRRDFSEEFVSDSYIAIVEQLVVDVAKWDKEANNLHTLDFFVRYSLSSSLATKKNVEFILADVLVKILSEEKADHFVNDMLFSALNEVVKEVTPSLDERLVDMLLEKIISPNLTWKVGKFAEMMRTHSLRCLSLLLANKSLLTNKHIEKLVVHDFAKIVSCLDEDSPEFRKRTIEMMPTVLQRGCKFLKDETEKWWSLCDEVAKMFNDNVDQIRIRAISFFVKYYEVLPSSLAESEDGRKRLDTVVANLLIHMDDKNVHVQNSAFDCLNNLKNKKEEVAVLVEKEINANKKFQNFRTESLMKKLLQK